MKKEIIILFFINISSAIGYSLIAPLYSSEAFKRGIKEDICGLIISMFAFSNFFATPFCPALIGKYGRKKILCIACIVEAFSTIIYGLIYYINGYYLFLLISIIARLAQGIGSSFSATLVYSIAASLCDPSQLKVTIGLMELAWCIGIAIGPLCASGFFFIGGYSQPFYVCGLSILIFIPFINNLNLPEEEEVEVPAFMTVLLDFDVITLALTVVIDMFTKTFFYPTFTNHLMSKFGMTVEGSSIFFVISISTYFIALNYINKVTSKIGYKLTICIGLFTLCLGPLFLSPILILPQSKITVIIGLMLLGVPDAFVSLPAICDLISILKNNKMKLDENTANDMASAVYNLSLNLGEAIGPIFGGFVTTKNNFEASCVYTSLLNSAYCIFFFSINYNIIKKQYEEGTLVSTPGIGDYERTDIHKALNDDNYIPTTNLHLIDKERTFIGRYRSYSYSNRSSKRGSFNTY